MELIGYQKELDLKGKSLVKMEKSQGGNLS